MPDEAVTAVLNQAPPLENFNRYAENRPLHDAVIREGARWSCPELSEAGSALGRADWIARGVTANRHPPEARILDRFGHRADTFEFHPAWHECLGWLKEHAIAGATWEQPKSGAHVRRAALFQLFAEVECGSLCPATMTHAAAPLIAREPELSGTWLPLLYSRTHDPRDIPVEQKRGALIGMGLTERQGGSDVRANITRAEPTGDGWYRLTGHKWFLSVATSDAFMVTAQAPGGLSCFFLPRFTPDGSRNPVHIVRAKDKLGDRSNASAEVAFEGALAYLVGEEGRGIATILEMANHTRLDCANGSAGIMRAALAQAVHNARHRRTFGKPLVDQPLMRNVLADMALEVEGHVALGLRVAGYVDRWQVSEEAALLGRLLTPIAKYWVCKRTPALVAEAMEATGGNGYIEDGPMPRLFRQAPLNSIWEGSGNIMCLDVLRVLKREPRTLEALITWLDGPRDVHPEYARGVDGFKTEIGRSIPDEAEARSLTETIATLSEAATLLADGLTPTSDAFCNSRLGYRHGQAFGTLPSSTDFAHILKRAGP